MSNFFKRLSGSAAILVICGQALAQSQQIPAPPQNQPVVVHSATIHTVSSDPIETNGYVVFDNGVITDVGQGRPPRVSKAKVIDASGLHIYPGFIAADTTMGLTETGSVAVTVDTTELGEVTPEVRAAVAINPDSSLIPVARSNGILTGLVFPRGGLVAGRCSTIRLDGWTWEQMTIDAEAGLVVSWPRTEPFRGFSFRRPQVSEDEQRKQIAERLEQIERLFDDARAYLRARDSDPTQATDLRYEAMRSVLSGEKPVFVRASSVGQIESAIAWATRRNLRIVIVGGQEASKAIPLLLKHDVPVIIGGLHRLPQNRYEPYDGPFTLPAKLHEAGVRFAIASGTSPAHERNLNHNAATAVAFGLPKSEALRAVTLSAAQIIGLGQTHGSIEVGKAATLIITQGDPLQITTDTLVAFIDGRQIDLGNRQKSMHEKYREKYRQLGLIGEN